MSTICKIALSAVEQDVLIALRSFLQERGLEFAESSSEWPLATNRDAFLPGQKFPSLFSVKQVSDAVTEIHFNSFSSVAELASFLSKQLATPVVVNEYQSVSTASYWALHSAGALIRSIEAGDGEVYAQQGAPLPFEGSEPGHVISDDDGQDAFFIFDDEDQTRYNQEAGFPVEVYEDFGPEWRNLQLPDDSGGSPGPASKTHKLMKTHKQWWRLW